MTLLLIGVFTFFLTHTFLWFYRSLKERMKRREEHNMTEFKRFNVYHRILHVVVVISFIGLVMTGMPLRYADAPWAAWFMKLFGGYRGAGLIHRICAVITFGYFVGHIIYVLYFIIMIKKFKIQPLRSGLHGAVDQRHERHLPFI